MHFIGVDCNLRFFVKNSQALEQAFIIENFQYNIEVTFNPVGSGAGLINLLSYSATSFDFVGSEIFPTSTEVGNNPGVQLIPFIAANVLIIYNIPGITISDPQLILTRSLLVDIFAFRVT